MTEKNKKLFLFFIVFFFFWFVGTETETENLTLRASYAGRELGLKRDDQKSEIYVGLFGEKS